MCKFETSPTGQRCVRAMSLRVLIRLHKWRDRCSNRRVKRLSGKEGCQNMLVDHLIQYRISQWPKTAEKCSFCTCVTDIRTNGRTDGWTDGQTDPLIEMRSWRTHLKTDPVWYWKPPKSDEIVIINMFQMIVTVHKAHHFPLKGIKSMFQVSRYPNVPWWHTIVHVGLDKCWARIFYN